jgi:hypothetical protein
VTHNRYYPSQKQFADAILAFMRETIPQEWTKFRDKVSDNFRVITHENFRVLKWRRYTNKLVRLIGTRHTDFIRASGYKHRAQRPDT